MNSEIMTAEQVAEYLKVDVTTVTRQARKGKIPGAQKVGYLWRFKRTAIEAWFDLGFSAEEKTQ
jgi:excisionase family DNA binding protein